MHAGQAEGESAGGAERIADVDFDGNAGRLPIDGHVDDVEDLSSWWPAGLGRVGLSRGWRGMGLGVLDNLAPILQRFGGGGLGGHFE